MAQLAVALMAAVAVYLVIGEPLLGKYMYELLQHQVTTDPTARIRFYRLTLLMEWGLTGVVALALWLDKTPLSAAGVRPVTGIPLDLLLVCGIALLLAPLTTAILIRMKPTIREAYAKRIGSLSSMFPITFGERMQFAAVAVTAGICEEFLFRGFLMFVLVTLVPNMPAWGAVAICAVIFGMAHVYQGWRGVFTTGLLGAVFGILYRLTGSLYVPMALHAYIDLQSLVISWAVHSGRNPSNHAA